MNRSFKEQLTWSALVLSSLTLITTLIGCERAQTVILEGQLKSVQARTVEVCAEYTMSKMPQEAPYTVRQCFGDTPVAEDGTFKLVLPDTNKISQGIWDSFVSDTVIDYGIVIRPDHQNQDIDGKIVNSVFQKSNNPELNNSNLILKAEF